VVDSVPNAKFVIIGDGSLRNQLESFAKNLGLSDSVIFKGRVDHLTKVRLIRNALCLVFPGLIEGFGMAAIEAFACGKAVLASNVPPSNQMFSPGIDSFLIDPFDVAGWSEKMLFMLKNPLISLRMGQSAWTRARSNFEMSLTISRHEEMYRRILESMVPR
jgi:glycosyltransferase involved in cell wall biosynthesis